MKKSHLAILLNVLVWIPRFYSLLIFSLPQVNLATPQVKINFLLSLEGTIESIVVFYIFYFFYSPLLFSKDKEKIRYALWFGSIVVLVISFIGYCVSQLIAPNYMNLKWFLPINILLLNIYAAFMAYLTKVFLNWYSDIFYKRQLEKKNLETELALLKAQINPHFLFNTLNNIDVLIEKDAAVASVYLKKLSDILRFTLYESPSETVALSEEIKYISQYIELQKIRTSNTDFVSFTVEGNTGDLRIAPMLFISFIENAFKHCTDKKINNAIEIDIAILNGEVHFICSNAFDISAQLTQPKSGLGLDLIKNRLKLLYKENYQLKIDKTNERFIVTLTVKLHEN
ncbi:sensor histidine kinase [Mucilaginibacter sp. X5P1]|uniref:sensor histidine kinase n=1 Tax=Mucilaginibacter sp. X5P1 TaxID=2723088 RepID=UPI0016102468|nr:sensor histidine kinase [Mucilaginibacter sp. X5P1]MBB6138885.1 sensor histidine kinase YesM [Mucilaginibacter sp. X5P1]